MDNFKNDEIKHFLIWGLIPSTAENYDILKNIHSMPLQYFLLKNQKIIIQKYSSKDV